MTPGKKARLYAVLFFAVPLSFQNCSKKNFAFINPTQLKAGLDGGLAEGVVLDPADETELTQILDQVETITEQTEQQQTDAMTGEVIEPIVADNSSSGATDSTSSTDSNSASDSSSSSNESAANSDSSGSSEQPVAQESSPVAEELPAVVEDAPAVIITENSGGSVEQASQEEEIKAEEVAIAEESENSEELADDEEVDQSEIDQSGDIAEQCKVVAKEKHKKHKHSGHAKGLLIVSITKSGKIDLDELAKDQSIKEILLINVGKSHKSIHHEGKGKHKVKVSACGVVVKKKCHKKDKKDHADKKESSHSCKNKKDDGKKVIELPTVASARAEQAINSNSSGNSASRTKEVGKGRK